MIKSELETINEKIRYSLDKAVEMAEGKDEFIYKGPNGKELRVVNLENFDAVYFRTEERKPGIVLDGKDVIFTVEYFKYLLRMLYKPYEDFKKE